LFYPLAGYFAAGANFHFQFLTSQYGKKGTFMFILPTFSKINMNVPFFLATPELFASDRWQNEDK
jgi:hypothetical protein